MGLVMSGPPPLTTAERAHLVLLGSTAGAPGIMVDAVKSGNIFDPAHMARAQELKKQWEDDIALLAPYMERQKRINAEREQLRQMGAKMEGKPKSYAHITIGDLGLPSIDWFLRIQTASGDYVDMKLAPYKDYIADCLLDACKTVPQFEAVLYRPYVEPVVIFTVK